MKKRKHTLEIIIAAVFLISSATALVIHLNRESRGVIGVYRDGVLLSTFTLDGIEPLDYEVVGENGEMNLVHIDSDGARMLLANCPDKLCVLHGKLAGNEPIICLPNRVVVKWLSAAELSAETASRTDATLP
ncbi:MAG: NusG domain II-containing protein [Oscillospiraceae bacterium]|jgi:hypothetical protein|nr:NusG domain II-containing protein [Oscillospiraceae bacterium]